MQQPTYLNKLTEDEVVILLKTYLEQQQDWDIGERYCLGATHGWDLDARKGSERLLIEVKGAKAGEKAPTKRRDKFNGGQIKIRFGRAL